MFQLLKNNKQMKTISRRKEEFIYFEIGKSAVDKNMKGPGILMFEGKSAMVKLNRNRVEDLNGIAIGILAV